MSIATHLMNPIVISSKVNQALLKTRIVHLGFGAFHRAHQALYTHEMLEKTQSDWGICEINLFSETLIKQLRAQQHRFLVAEKGAQETLIKEIACVKESLSPGLDGQQAVIEKMAEPQIAIVSLTITEKGYCLDHATGQLDTEHPLIQEDLLNPSQPRSAIGYIVEALRLRQARELSAFTILSCDNVQENGHHAKAAILKFAQLIDPALAQWIEKKASFPCTMVDRIVPAATPDTLSEITTLSGVTDPCAIACEPFRQWVIEDNFVQGRPDWDVAGAEFVEDVIPFEEMKLRMLNGSHSFLAYLGYLGGYPHIADTMENDDYKKVALSMMLRAQAVTLNMPNGTDVEAYAHSLIARFSNPALKHQTWQIAMDGSQKIPQRFGASLQHHLNAGSDYQSLALGIAGWMHYVGGVDEQGQVIDVRDPLSSTFEAIYQQHKNAEDIVNALLSIDTIFSQTLRNRPHFVAHILQAYQSIKTHGARKAVALLNQ